MLPGIGIFGIDEFTTFYIENLQKHMFKIYGIYGSDINVLNNIATKYGIALATLKTDEILLHQEINLILFMNEDANNFEYVSKALKIAGKHVICCRMFSASIENALEIYESSLKYPILLSAIENPLRYNNAIILFKNYFDNKVIGEFLYCDCYIESASLLTKSVYTNNYEISKGGGLLQKIGVFVIDALMYIMSQKIKKLLCVMRTLVPMPDPNLQFLRSDSDDYFTILAQLTNSSILNINGRTSEEFNPGHYKHKIKIVGNLGTLTLENNTILLNLKNKNKEETLYRPEKEIFKFPPMGDDYQETMINELTASFSTGKYSPDKTMIKTLLSFKEGAILRSILDAAISSNLNNFWSIIPESVYNDQHNPINQKIQKNLSFKSKNESKKLVENSPSNIIKREKSTLKWKKRQG